MSSADDHRRTWVADGGTVDTGTVGHLTEMPATPEADGRYLAGPPGSPRVTPQSIGEGAIGRVLLMFDGHLGREVAVKELIGGARGTGSGGSGGPFGPSVDRFVREARVTAQLEHPGIVPVYELGRRPDGTLYYVMKRVRGQTLQEAIAQAPDLPARLKLLDHYVQLCQAIAYAHSRGVIHRDIKPQNIMVGEFGETVVLDWGLAKVRGETDTSAPDIERGVERILAAAGNTMDGATMGTPAYMSPEQAYGRVDAIDERSDIWSLGAVLYEILTGKPPYEGEHAYEVLDRVRSDPPAGVRTRERAVSPELGAICAKALERDPARRYQDARALASDVAAWQTDGQVAAYRYAWWEVAGRYLFRNRGVVTVLSLAVLALSTSALVFLRHLTDERDRARAAESVAQGERNETRTTLARSLGERARSAVRDGDGAAAWVLGASALALEEDADARGAVVRGRSAWVPRLSSVRRLDQPCLGLGWRGDGALVCVTRDRLHLWGPDGAMVELAEPGLPDGATGAFAWSADGVRLAAGGRGEIRVWDADRGRIIDTIQLDDDNRVWALGWHPDGLLIAGGSDGLLRTYLDGQARTVTVAHGAAIRALAISADGARVATAGADHSLKLWDTVGYQELAPLTEDAQGGLSVAFAVGGRELAAVGDATGGDGLVRVWDITTGRVARRLAGHLGEVETVAWTPDGTRLVSGGDDGTARVWDVVGGRTLGLVRLPGEQVTQVAVSPDGTHFAVAGSSGSVRAWTLPANPAGEGLSVEPRSVNAVAWSADGAHLLVGGEDGRAVTWDARDGRRVGGLVSAAAGVVRTAFLPSGGAPRVMARTAGGRVLVVDPATGTELVVAGDGTEAWNGDAVSPDGAWLAVGTRAGLRLIDLANGGSASLVLGDGIGVQDVAWTQDGARLLLTDVGGGLRFFDRRTGTVTGRLGTIDSGYRAPALSPDGRWAAASVADGRIVVWSLPEGTQSHVLSGHTDAVDVLRFSPDGTRLFSAGADRLVCVWDTARGRLLARFEAHRNRIWDGAWSPDGTRVATASADHTARIWDLRDLEATPADLLAAARAELGLAVVQGQVELVAGEGR